MEVYNKGGDEKTIIMGVRQWVAQRFIAPDWLDLRIGFLLSITDASGDDTITDLEETISASPSLGAWDRYYIGVMERASLATFIGFTNRGNGHGQQTLGDSVLVSSDAGIGTDNENFWWPRNSFRASYSGQIIEQTGGGGGITRFQSRDNVQQHFAQDASGAGGYATLLSIRLQRDNVGGRSHIITATVKQGTHSTDVLFSDDPTRELLQTNLESFPGTVQTWGPVELQRIPDALFLYWPFHNSRLRIHCMGVEKIAT